MTDTRKIPVFHNAHPLWARVATTIGSALIGFALVTTFTISPWMLAFALLGMTIWGVAMYPTTHTARERSRIRWIKAGRP